MRTLDLSWKFMRLSLIWFTRRKRKTYNSCFESILKLVGIEQGLEQGADWVRPSKMVNGAVPLV